MLNTRVAFTLRDQSRRGTTAPADPLIQRYHDEWLSRPFGHRHTLVNEWRDMSDAEFYQQPRSYLEGLIRLSDAWLKRAPRSPDQVTALARAHGRRAQDVKRDLDKIMRERQLTEMIAREQRATRRVVRREKAALAYTEAYTLALADEEYLDDDE